MAVNPYNFTFLKDPLAVTRVLWPHIRLWWREEELIYSMWHNRYTVCKAGNMMGKDFTVAIGVVVFFLTRPECRIVTTSVDGTQLAAVLWGEIRNLLNTSKIPLDSTKGGPLVVNDMHIRRVHMTGPMKGMQCGLSYIIGRMAKKGEGMLGHHLAETVAFDDPKTMFVGDEASGLDPLSIERGETWADRMVLIGNPYPCENQFKSWCKEGDQLSDRRVKDVRGVTLGEPTKTVEQYDRKVITIPCAESPNVELGELESAQGKEVTNRMLYPGVMSHWKYKDRRKRWDKVKQCIQLNAEFWEGSDLLLFPPDWMDCSANLELDLFRMTGSRIARAIGCDPGEGEAESAWYVVDDYGILEEVAFQTPDTTKINPQTLSLMRKWNVPPELIMYDRGGGGLQHAQALQAMGYRVKTVGFGESVAPPPKRGLTTIEHKVEQQAEAYAYVSRRVEMFHHLSQLIEPLPTGPSPENPNLPDPPRRSRFCIPKKYAELRRQLAPFPKQQDKEGRYRLPPKNRLPGSDSKEKTLTELIGNSPDRADALAIAVYARDFAVRRANAGAA